MRQTPIPLLRDLAPDVLVVRCGLCQQMVLASECCEDITQAPQCPSREAVDSGSIAQNVPWPIARMQLLTQGSNANV
jgi:hypothetical protein